jgi:hypothetical protein
VPALLFSTASPASIGDVQAAYNQRSERFRAELYVTHQTRPLLTTQPQPHPPPATPPLATATTTIGSTECD